ncbi:MAG: hypothetical protein ACKO38_14500, partial [Planctomycetota bacterium]
TGRLERRNAFHDLEWKVHCTDCPPKKILSLDEARGSESNDLKNDAGRTKTDNRQPTTDN